MGCQQNRVSVVEVAGDDQGRNRKLRKRGANWESMKAYDWVALFA